MDSKRDNLIEYKNYLKSLLESGSEDVFMNSGVGHANVLLSTLFDNTQKNIRIFSNGLDEKGVCGEEEYKKSLISLAKSARLESMKIMLRSQPTKENELYKQLCSEEKVEIKVIDSTTEEEMLDKLNCEECNFSVYDNKMFRLEYEPDEYKAAGSFNFPSMAEKLSEIFDSAFAKIGGVAAKDCTE